MRPWPQAWTELEGQLRSGRGMPGIVDGQASMAEQLVSELRQVVVNDVSLGVRLAMFSQMPPIEELVGVLDGSTLLTDIDVLLSPQLDLDVLGYLRQLARAVPVVAVWPGRIAGRRLTYSLPGRVDYVDVLARDLIVLHPLAKQFPDEIPYQLERFPP